MCATARSCGRNEMPPRTVDVLGGVCMDENGTRFIGNIPKELLVHKQ